MSPSDGLPSRTVDPNDPPWNSLIAFGLWVLSVALVVLVPSVILVPYLLMKSGGLEARQMADAATKDPTAIFIQVAAILPAHLLTLTAAWLIVTSNRRFSFRDALGWNSGGVRWWHYVAILSGFFAVMLVVASFVPEQDNEMLRMLKSSQAALYTIAILSVVTAPIVEEVVYRGVVYSAFQRSVGQYLAVGLTTLLFALVHVPQYWPSFSTIFLLTLLSLILTLLRAYSGNLWPCIVLHTLFNGFQSALLIAEPHLNVPGSPTEQAVGIFLMFK